MSKKTETIEVRISPELKARLSEVCESRGQAMSQLIRQLVQAEISDSAQDSTQSESGAMARSGRRKLRELGTAGVSLLILALVWNLAAQTPAAAQMEARITFAEMDRNDDGIITREEYDLYTKESFVLGPVEAEGEGAVEEVEACELPQACEADFAASETDDPALETVAEAFQDYDLNDDGRVVFDELRRAIRKRRAQEFAELDGDADGFLTRKEFDAEFSVAVLDGETGLSPACVEALAAQDAAFLQGASDDLRMAFATMDENRDNRISRREYLNN